MTRPPIPRLYMGFSLLVLLTASAPFSASAQSPQSVEAFTEPQNLQGERAKGASGLPLPRFVSIMSDAANVRRGPGPDFPLLWQYQRRNLPLEVIAEYDTGAARCDHQGEEAGR